MYTQYCCHTNTVTGIIAGDRKTEGKLDLDGFPPIGTLLQEGDPYYWYIVAIIFYIVILCHCIPMYSYIDESCNQAHVKYYKSAEPAFIDQVRRYVTGTV